MSWGTFMTVTPVLLVVGCACSPDAGPTTGSESHFLLECDDGCGPLECICGVCTRTCETAEACRDMGSSALCVQVDARPADALCPDVAAVAFCDLPCVENANCQLAGENFFCQEGYCREDELSLQGEPFPGFGALCEAQDVTCSTETEAPVLIGSYTGTGNVVFTSNALWDVGNAEVVTVQIAEQFDGTLSGTATLEAFDITVAGGLVRGNNGAFTIYGTDAVDYQACAMEARVVISGVLDELLTPAVATGTLALRFTGNFDGAGCTTEQRTTYPGTGANFGFSATRLP